MFRKIWFWMKFLFWMLAFILYVAIASIPIVGSLFFPKRGMFSHGGRGRN